MKKLSLFLAAVSMLWVLSACGGQPQADSNTSTPEASAAQSAMPSATPQPVQGGGSLNQGSILIAYFSLWDNAPWEQEGVDTSTSASVVVDKQGAVGTNAYVARMIQSEVGGDLHTIIAADPYPADFDQVRDMQNVKMWIAAVLALALILALALSTMAFAAVDDTGFSDVNANDWYAEAVMYCHENELMGGTGNSAFSPNTTMTRAMLATVLWRIADEPVVNYLMQFSDVADSVWSTSVVNTSKDGFITPRSIREIVRTV